MAELLRLESTRLYGSSNRGCIWGLFHMIDSYQRRVNKRMVSNRKQGGRQCGVASSLKKTKRSLGFHGTDILMKNETGEDTDADKGESNIVKNKANDMNKRSGKTHILKFIGKKLLKRQKHKGKMSNSSSQLMRTNSVHHLESNDCVTPGELSRTTSDSETSTITVGLDETDSLAINGLHISVEGNQIPLGDLNTTGYNIGCISHKLNELGNHLLDEHIVLKEKIFEARDALLKQKDSDPKGMTVEFLLLSQNFLDILHLFNINREALYNVCKGQNSFVANDMQALGCPAKAIELNRSVSFAGFGLSGNAAGIPIPSCKHIEFDKFINQGSKHESVKLLTKTFGVVPDIEFLTGSNELRKQGETKTVLSRLRELKQRLKSVIVENKKEHHRISMDRILDKVPSGHKFLEDEEDGKLNRREGPVSEKNFKDGNGFKFYRMAPGSSIGKFAHNGVQRSRSLTESLDRYSQLLDSISSIEVRKAPESSNSIRESSGLLHRKLPKTHRRMPSNPEFLSSSSFTKDVQSEAWIAFQSSNKPTLETFDSDFSPTSGGSDKLNKGLVIQPAIEEIAYEQEGPLESNIVINAVKAHVPDKFVTPAVETSITETKWCERQPGSVNECLQIAPFQFSKIVEEKNDLFNEKESQIEDEPNVKPEKTSPISVLDSNIEEPVSPLKFTVMAGSDPHQLHKKLEEQLPFPQDQNNVDFNELNINEETISTTGDQAKSFISHIDEKDTPRFNYVKHILSKTGYEALICDTEDSSIEVHAGIPFDEQLIYDLINEVLFEIYEYSTAPSSWLSRFHSKIRSMPTGSYLLEEVWAEITWHLSSPQGLDAMADKLLARNFTKTDDWMNLYRDAECFGLLLEQLILDDLVDEVVVDN